MLTHIVFFKLKPEAASRDSELVERLRQMREAIPELVELEAGLDVSRSGRSWDAALLTRFRSKQDLETYRAHPVHQEALKVIQEICAETAVVDYEA